MLYAWIGYLKAGADPIPQSVQQETTDFLGQPSIKIRAAGPLRDESGKRAAMMMGSNMTAARPPRRSLPTAHF